MIDLEKPEQINSTEFNLRSGSFQLSLRFAPDALATLVREIGAGYLTLRRRAAEAGGLPAGEIVKNNSDWIVTIQGVTPVSIQCDPCAAAAGSTGHVLPTIRIRSSLRSESRRQHQCGRTG